MRRLALKISALVASAMILGAVSCPQTDYVEGFRKAVADYERGRGYDNPNPLNETFLVGYKEGWATMVRQSEEEFLRGYSMGGPDGGGDGGGDGQ